MALSRKRQILDAAGYRYDFVHEVFLNRASKKMFSWQFVEDHSPEELEVCIGAEPAAQWSFYFNSPPSKSVRQQLEDALA